VWCVVCVVLWVVGVVCGIWYVGRLHLSNREVCVGVWCVVCSSWRVVCSMWCMVCCILWG